MEGLVSTYGIVFITIIVISVLIHTFVVVRVLRQYGHGPLTGWINISQYRELREYKKICMAEGKPLIWWRVLYTLDVLCVVGVIGWFLLFLV
jgi:hypothetical protein